MLGKREPPLFGNFTVVLDRELGDGAAFYTIAEEEARTEKKELGLEAISIFFSRFR